MRVLEVAASWRIQSQPGGGESYFAEFVKNLARICETDILVGRNHPHVESSIRADLRFSNSRIFTVSCWSLRFPRFASALNPLPSFFGKDWRNLNSLLEQGAYDVLHIHNFRTWIAAAFTLKAAKHYSRRERPLFILTDHGALTFPFPELLIKNFDAFANPTVMFNSFYQQMSHRSIRSVNLGAGVDHNKFRPLNIEKKYDIISVGRVADWKGLDVLVKAVGEAQISLRRKLRLIHVGPIHDGGYKNSIVSLCSRTGVTLEFLGVRSWRELPTFYNQSRIMVYPSKERSEFLGKIVIRHKVSEEQIGIAVLESMSCGTPAIVSDIGALPETVNHGMDGYVFPARDAKALSNYIVRLMNDEALLKRLGENARKRVLSDFQWHRVASKFAQLCSEVEKTRKSIDGR